MTLKTDSTNIFVQYGCGWSAPLNWTNFDASPTLRFERLPILGSLYIKNAERFPPNALFGDIVKGLPIPSGTCDLVYCSHVLEHLALEDFRVALKNTLSLLRPGGIFRMVMPDMRHSVKTYLDDPSPSACEHFIRETGLGREHRPRSTAGLIKAWLGNSPHLWMWDYSALQEELIRAGFVSIRPAKFGDSSHPAFADVENLGRWTNALGAECQRPESTA